MDDLSLKPDRHTLEFTEYVESLPGENQNPATKKSESVQHNEKDMGFGNRLRFKTEVKKKITNSHRASAITNAISIHEDTGLIPGLAQ